jgi:hypothetical protein
VVSDTSNGRSTSKRGDEQTASGRDGSGRFAAGNKGGPGNPFARQTAAMRKAVIDAVTEEQLAAIAGVMVKKALDGDVGAAKLVFSYAAGKPGPAADPDTLDAHELAVRRGNTGTADDVRTLFEKCPAWLVCAIAAVVAPQVQAHLETTFAQGVRRQEADQRGQQKASPDSPGPYHGRKADWAPSSVNRGISDEVSEVFEACPAWMPDVTEADRLPHAYADVLRSVRRSLLDALPGAAANPRPPATAADSKRVNRPGAGHGSGSRESG